MANSKQPNTSPSLFLTRCGRLGAAERLRPEAPLSVCGLGRLASAVGLLFTLGCVSACSEAVEPTRKPAEVKAGTATQALVAEDGVSTVAQPDSVVNAYAVLAADAALGAVSLSVTNVADLTVGGLGALAAGDLLLVYQAQGATMDTTDSAAYGTVASLGNAGGYEVVGVQAVNGNSITLSCALKHAYSAAGKTQVVRVPQYDSLTVNNGASIVAPNWDGARGGIVAVHAKTVTLNGAIDVSARGFRGGAVDNMSGATGRNVPTYRIGMASEGAEKGEGVAGSATEYDALLGRYGRGAPINGGGGGNSHNAGGGGGANTKPAAVNLNTWNGAGFMDTNAAWLNAWMLDPAYAANGNARTTSPGGGRGGYTYSNSNQNALTRAPGEAQWQGDNRQERGGLGGRPLDADPTGRVFFGGGGGAGDGNNNGAGRGGLGGGLVIVIATTVTGTGVARANGEDGQDTSGGHNDAPGGGGAGGSVIIDATTLSGISIEANGGEGGTQFIGSNAGLPLEAEGPGGGGGGGLVAVLGGNVTASVVAGIQGTTTAPTLSEFIPNGATQGGPGLSLTTYAGAAFCTDATAPETTIDQKPANPSTLRTPSFVFLANEPNVTFECRIDGAPFATCPANYTASTLTLGQHTIDVRAIDAVGNVDASPATYTWTILLDTDGDGIADTLEPGIGTDPNDADTDDDGALDGAEPQPGVDTDGDGLVNALDPDSDNDGLLDGTELGSNCQNPQTVAAKCVSDADNGATKTDPLNRDTDGGGATDGSEDSNLDGKVDQGETNPIAGQGADDAGVIDTDGDGLGDGLEGTLGSLPNDADTDDDGLLDRLEANPAVDGDADGLINVLDVDSDNDALFDGTETGKPCDNPATNQALGYCIADADTGATKTSPVKQDTDGGGVRDGSEDGNRNGGPDQGETDPTAGHQADDSGVLDTDSDGLSDILETNLGSGVNDADSDDDGLLDGLEPNPSEDHDRDGSINVRDRDSDADGLFDGTEAGKDCANTATDAAAASCTADADAGATKTWVLIPDTDKGGVADGLEDDNKNGRVDANERDPNLRTDDGCETDSNCGAAQSGIVCVAHACVPGCRGTGGNGCLAGAVCSSVDATVGQCSVPNAGAGGMAGAAGAGGIAGAAGAVSSGGAGGASLSGGSAGVATGGMASGGTPGSGGAAAGGAASGGTPSAASGGSAKAVGATVEGGGCSCRIAPDPQKSSAAQLAGALGGLAFAYWRRRTSRKRGRAAVGPEI
ncbi:MAG: hypothetical protein SFV15_21980 [Polyangiaceae bacterium]|nr:hypothetical protein [Polyangiaceae bacterium]